MKMKQIFNNSIKLTQRWRELSRDTILFFFPFRAACFLFFTLILTEGQLLNSRTCVARFAINRVPIQAAIARHLCLVCIPQKLHLPSVKNSLEDVRKIKVEEKIKQLTDENGILAAKVEKAKAELIRLETLNGKKQYPIPGRTAAALETEKAPIKNENEAPAPKKEKKEKDNSAKAKPKPPANDGVVTVGKLDFRIGKIVEINKHPDADSLYVEKIDCGEENPRTVVSGLVNHVPITEMQDRIVMVLCNLKPVKMRGVTSEAMVMCASSPEKVEVLIPPSGAQPGDLVSCEGFPREPEAILNPKKKIFETCAPDLKTNSDKIACYKGTPLTVPGKGPVVAPTLKEVNVK